MADCSRPPHRNQRGLAKNLSGGFGFGSKGVHDDVFAARPKMRAAGFTPGAKDYAEIFNCKQPSSIPVLELEEFEVRSSEVDYGNVFGRFDEGQIVSSYEEVFPAGDGVGRTDDLRAHSRGSDRPTAVEESQKLTNESLRRKERSMSFDNNRGGNGETDEINSQAKNSHVPVSTSAFDGTVLLKSAEVSRSGALMNNFKQCSEEAPVEKHDDDGFIEIDVNSGNRYGSDKSIASHMPMDADVVRSKALISEAIIASNYISHLGSPVATSKELAGWKSDECRSNASKDPYVGLSGSSREGVEVQNVHGLDKPFVSDSAEDETATDGIISHSQQDDVTCSGKSFSKFPVNATAAGLQAENSKSIPETHSQHNFGETNTAAEGDLVPDAAASRNADSESTDGDSNGHLTSSVKPKNEAGLDESISSDMPVDTEVIDLKAHNSEVAPLPSVQSNLDSGVPILKKATTSKSGEFRRSTYASVRDDHAPSFSDDEIDKNSVAAISAAAIKTAIREAQAWISIAKESNGVKGFMKHVVAKNFRQVKEGKEAINLKVKEKPKLFEQGQTAIGNNSSTSATRKDYVAPWATSLETKRVPGQTVEEVNFKETEFCASDRLNQREDAVIRSSSRKTLETASAIQHATPSISTSEEKLTAYSSKSEEKLVHRKEDTSMQGVDLDSGLASLVPEAKCSEVPNTEKRETNMASTGEAVINKYDETKIRIAEESQEPINSDQGFTVRSFQDAFGHCNVGCSANSFEVKEDLASAYLEEENEKESELDPRDQLSDYDDTDLQDYASAEENLVSTNTDDETCDKDLNSPAQNQLDDIEDNISMQSTVEATTVSEDVLAPCFNNLNEEPVIEETDENEVMPLQNKVTHDTKVTQEERTVPVFRHSNEDSVIDEAKVTQEERTVPVFRHSNEDSVVEETDVIGDLPILNTVTPEAKNTSEDGVAPCFDSADEESIVEETGGIEHMTEQNMVIPEADIVSEDVVAPCFDSSNECMIVEEIIADTEELTVSSPNHEHVKAVEDVTEQNTEIPEASFISEGDIAPYFDSSNEGLMVDEMLVDTTEKAGMSSPNHAYEKGAAESATLDKEELENVARVEAESARVSSPNHAHEKGAAESATCCMHEHATFDEEELENVASVEAESASVVGRASSHPEGPGVELPRRDVSEDSVSETIKESRSTAWRCEHEKQEVGAATFSDLEPITQAREELHNVATVESDFIGGFEPKATRGSENNQVNIDSAREEEVANELESTPLYPDHVDHELKAGSRFCEPLPDFIQTEETTNFEHHGESLIQPLERHERKKWEMPKEAFELPEVLKSGISEVHDTLEQDSCELKRQTDKHERKKWEIPRETFKLPVLDDEVVGVIEEKEDQESVTLSAEKPERKKWKIQKEVFEVPTLFAGAVQETSEQEGFVIKTASEEEMRIRDDRFSKLLFSEESDQHGEVQKEFSADEEVVVPDAGVFPGICADDSPDHMEKERMPEIKMLGEEERVNQFNETSDQQETKVEEGAAAGQEECMKGQEDINVKDELKRTLGMLWKKIYKSQQDEDLETGDSMTEENYTFKDEKGRGGVDKGLNLKGPVELVESPRQQDDIEALNFSDQSSGDEENEKETSFSKQFEANGSEPSNSGDFISTTEVTEDSSSASFPCKLQEDDSRSCTEETCKQYYTANDVESRSKEIPSSLGSVGSAETTQIHGHGADKSLNKGSPEKNTPPSDVNECGWIDCEAADNINTSLVTRKAKTDDDKPSRMEATGSMRKEVTPDQEVLNNIMRAKEIERIVVERTIREVRERAFAEARERADRYRANAEAQQKALADDQERSQETSSEAKLAAEKNSLEGKRKSELERAAVERATAEARQRALEKAMSRQVSDGSSSKSANAADHGSSSKDRITNDKPSESALRFKSRNERHQRIAERAAKALEEKNMRDLLVQREQAERSRLSEVLDADVKRWASGKTSNLRALLSTLQYILGPDSGWKPIHLTDILTADAVKKAYRKATLFIHPDKLQQRGASIKQKYICEQVFDLLKEAWNNFDRDER